MNEHDRQIPTRVALPERHVYIFSRALSFFKETELGSIVKHLLHFLLLDAVLESQLINTSLNQMIPLILINTAYSVRKFASSFFPSVVMIDSDETARPRLSARDGASP